MEFSFKRGLGKSFLSNRAVTFSLLNKGWQVMAGLITIPMVLVNLDPILQGYFYTFNSLIALQSFFELGFSVVITVYTAHEWGRLKVADGGEVIGNEIAKSRLISLGRFVFVYFGLAALLYFLVAGVVGFYILGRESNGTVIWIAPWFIYIFFSSISLWISPSLSLLEGSNQMVSVVKFKLIQSFISNFVLWVGLILGGELWALTASSFISLIILLGYVVIKKYKFMIMFFDKPKNEKISWKSDLFPMQWRLALQGLFSYLSFPLFTVLAYYYSGAVGAGKMGVTLQLIGGIQAFSLVLLTARTPEFASLAALNKLGPLVTGCKSATNHCLIATMLLSIFLTLIVFLGSVLKIPEISRLMGADSVLYFSIGVTLISIVQGIALFLRVQKKEILTAVGVISGLCQGLLAWIICKNYGYEYIALSYLLAVMFISYPITIISLKINRYNFSDFIKS